MGKMVGKRGGRETRARSEEDRKETKTERREKKRKKNPFCINSSP
jgi:hypothetical protein